MPTYYRFVVHGRVQGVGFRQATLHQARQLGLHGWVRNRADGTVEGEAGHDRADLLANFYRWLQHGPAMAEVQIVEWTQCSTAAPLDIGFSIRS